jgi:hypothetical protein
LIDPDPEEESFVEFFPLPQAESTNKNITVLKNKRAFRLVFICLYSIMPLVHFNIFALCCRELVNSNFMLRISLSPIFRKPGATLFQPNNKSCPLRRFVCRPLFCTEPETMALSNGMADPERLSVWRMRRLNQRIQRCCKLRMDRMFSFRPMPENKLPQRPLAGSHADLL